MASVELVGRLLVSLAVVLGLMWVVVRRMKKGGGKLGRGGKLIEVLDRASLTRSASVAVVRVNGQGFVLGVAEHGVTILGETDLGSTPEAREAVPRRSAHRVTRVTTTATTPTTSTMPEVPAPKAGALTGSALSPQTWRQTVESLRDLTART